MERIIYEFQGEPSIRLKIAKGKNQLDFYTLGEFSIIDDQDQIVMQKISSDRRWRIKLEAYEPAQFAYALKINIKRTLKEAEQTVQGLIQRGYDARLQMVGGLIRLNGEILSNNTHYRILVGQFNTAADAFSYGLNCFNSNDIEVVHEKIREPRGTFEIFDSEYEQSVKINNELTIILSGTENEIILWDSHDDNGDNNAPLTPKYYQWPIRFCAGDCGGILAICNITLEKYLQGVLNVEMGQDYPLEVLKSQAVASRSLALTKIGQCHHEEPYDLCNRNHCQQFHGLSDYAPNIKKAIQETRGEFLFYNRSVYETRYSIHCGGHTESEFIMENGSAPYLHGIWDGPKQKQTKSLTDEKTVAQWVTSEPHVYCNPNGKLNLHPENFTSSQFRWEVTYSRYELEEIIYKKTGEDIGTLFDILPVKRGNSGRLIEVEILGSRKNIRIKREHNIRHALSERWLNSSCFVIEIDVGSDGIPLNFSFIGAGTGHGVGLCQTGATVMALKGESYKKILGHYYRRGKLRKIY